MKRVFVILISICLIGCLLTGCGTKEDQYGNWADNHSDDCQPNYHIGLLLYTSIVYAKDTKVIYYYISGGAGASYMAPYYNEHGQLCRYVDGEITPIE